ncbi:MAG: hypothetical protein E7Z64_02250 [Thermoplasmata archaeon]|nr:hypothetical protein [Thermoplasmata archaeon]
MAAIMAFVSLLVMTRCVPNEYGVMMWALALVSLVNTVADLGFNSANLKFIAKEGYDQSACFTSYMVIKIVLTVLLSIITVATVFIMAELDMKDTEALHVCLVLLIYQIISNVQFAIYYTLDGLMLSGKSAILTIVECFLRNLILIIFALMESDAMTLASAYVYATIVSVIISVIMVHSAGIRLVRPKYLREYIVFAAPLAAALILTSILTYLAQVLIGLYYPHQDIEVTYYTTAVGAITTLTAVGVSLNNVLLPHLSKNIANRGKTEYTLWYLEKILCVVLFPFVTFLIILGPEVAVVLFGDRLGPSGEMISILAIHIIPFVIAGVMTQVLYAINKGKAYLRASVLMCIIAVAGFFILIPDETFMPFCFGLKGVGAAISVTVSYMVFVVILILMVKKMINHKLYPNIWKLFVAFIISSVAIYAIDQLISIHGFIQLALAGIFIEIMFLGTLYLMKEFSMGEVRTIWRKFRNDED